MKKYNCIHWPYSAWEGGGLKWPIWLGGGGQFDPPLKSRRWGKKSPKWWLIIDIWFLGLFEPCPTPIWQKMKDASIEIRKNQKKSKFFGIFFLKSRKTHIYPPDPQSRKTHIMCVFRDFKKNPEKRTFTPPHHLDLYPPPRAGYRKNYWWGGRPKVFFQIGVTNALTLVCYAVQW